MDQEIIENKLKIMIGDEDEVRMPCLNHGMVMKLILI